MCDRCETDYSWSPWGEPDSQCDSFWDAVDDAMEMEREGR